MRSFDVIGKIAVLKFKAEKLKEKRKKARELIEKHKNIKTVVEKIERVKGRLRTIRTKHLAGIKTLETLHKENRCVFKVNIEKCYFSPRLSNERMEIARQVKRNEKILVMFSGVAPYAIVIAKLARPKKIIAIEVGKESCRYARENIKLNKLKNIEIIQGNVKKIIPKLKAKRERFDRIVMPRPQLKDSFIEQALLVSKNKKGRNKRTIINYYDFCKEDELAKIIEKIEEEAKKQKKKIRILNVKKAGEIAPYKYRFRIDFSVE